MTLKVEDKKLVIKDRCKFCSKDLVFWTQIPLDICRLLIISEGLNPEDQIISVDTFWLGLDGFLAGLLHLLLVTVKLVTHLDDAADPLLVVGDPGVPGGNSFSTSHPSRDDAYESSSVLVLLVHCCERSTSISLYDGMIIK